MAQHYSYLLFLPSYPMLQDLLSHFRLSPICLSFSVLLCFPSLSDCLHLFSGLPQSFTLCSLVCNGHLRSALAPKYHLFLSSFSLLSTLLCLVNFHPHLINVSDFVYLIPLNMGEHTFIFFRNVVFIAFIRVKLSVQ